MNPPLERLRDRMEQLGGGDAYPVVPLELFFEGNHDGASIGPNLAPHPGVETFFRVLTEIRERREVADVVLQVSEVMPGEDEWPFVEAAYVMTTAAPETVHEWAAEFEPHPYEPGAAGGWLYGEEPPGAPDVPADHRLVVLYWD